MSSSVDKIKERLGIVDLVGSYVKLERAGNSFKAKCPFHNEKTASFFVSPERDSYYCFGCGAKGDIFTFVEEFEGLDFRGALKVLAGRAGVELVPENPKRKNERERLFEVMNEAAAFFEKNLSAEKSALDYLKKRGLEDKTVKEWRIGYAKPLWQNLENHLKSKNFSETEMEKAGLIKKEAGKSYDRFRDRIIFPISDSSGRIIAFSGRILRDDGKSPKYLNSPETELFSKSKTLYGFDKAKLAIKKMDYSILVEGQMDLIMCHQAGYANAVASSGTALTRNHLEIIKRLSNRVIMAFDADNAGFNASAKAWQIALSLGMEVKIAELPEGFDPAELILKNKDKWAASLMEAKHIIDFYLNRILGEESDERKIALKIKNVILPFIASIESNMEKSHFLAKISAAAGIKEESMWDDLKKINFAPNGRDAVGRESENYQEIAESRLLRKDLILRRIAGILFWQESKDKPLISADKTKEALKVIIGEKEFNELSIMPEGLKSEIIFEAEIYYENAENAEKDLNNLFLDIEEEYLKMRLAGAVKELSESEKAKIGEEEMLKILNKCQTLARRLEDFKKKKR
ncbi:MAG: DNA primase [Patescibacteria group bacterium]|nr:DNA primase [Patescibacteria group bacterium]MDE2217831.1 DNA primase [Patescibacteria group bacterium]